MSEGLKLNILLCILGIVFLYIGIKGIKKNKKELENNIISFNSNSNLGLIILGTVFIVIEIINISIWILA